MAGPETEPATEELRNRSKKLKIDKVDTLASENAGVGSEEQAKSARRTYGRTPEGRGMHAKSTGFFYHFMVSPLFMVFI